MDRGVFSASCLCNTSSPPPRRSRPYSDFEKYLKDGMITEVAVSDRFIQGTLKEPLPDGKRQFVNTRVDPQFAEQLQRYGVRFRGR
jgi:cell division protease FtsH